MDNNKEKTSGLKRAAAVLGFILIAAALLILVVGAATHNTGLMMTGIICLVFVPILIYLFLMLVRMGKKRVSDVLESGRSEE